MIKNIIIACVLFLSCMAGADEPKENIVDKNFIERVFKEVLEDLTAGEEVISKYFSPSYIQNVDGHTLNYNDFVQHMLVQKTMLNDLKVTIERSSCEKNKICTVHRVDATKKDGSTIAVKVIAHMELENNKIVLCDELTHLIKGSTHDANIGSIK